MNAIEMIAAERQRQRDKEGWSEAHDDNHTDGALVKRAAELAVDGTDARVHDPVYEPDPWGLVAKHGYMGTRPDRVRALTIAGALIVAELERVIRAALEEG